MGDIYRVFNINNIYNLIIQKLLTNSDYVIFKPKTLKDKTRRKKIGSYHFIKKPLIAQSNGGWHKNIATGNKIWIN